MITRWRLSDAGGPLKILFVPVSRADRMDHAAVRTVPLGPLRTWDLALFILGPQPLAQDVGSRAFDDS